ncbi:Vasodilator-stimulated phosphoprotein [Schistosoma japonicum]|uniref:Vasodilator-stimulated phosphoprotein n=1 Tax=Schistosoma japonicum TaxID=6182 RepID=C1LF02_SCHJA|nr:Vasodilator-stimulated phosphoprotein [Schistosoma japonicum]CAX73280.1 vasodilator-stimulated phosphoprotein [Schistosoma japonicum]
MNLPVKLILLQLMVLIYSVSYINCWHLSNNAAVEYTYNQYSWFNYIVQLFNMILYSNLNILYQQPGQICPGSGTSDGIQYPGSVSYQYQYQAQQQIPGQTQYFNHSQSSTYPTSVYEQNQDDKLQHPTGLQESGTEQSNQSPSVSDLQMTTELKLGEDYDSSLINAPQGVSHIQSTTDTSLFNEQQQKSSDQPQVTTDQPNDFQQQQQQQVSTTSSQPNQSDSDIDYSLINLT